MNLQLLPLLFLLSQTSHKAQVPSTDFARIMHEADQARTSDQLTDAIRLYRQAVDLRPSSGDGWWWLGSIFYEQDRFPEAQAAFEHFISSSPKPAPAYAFLALCEYENGDYDRALQHFRFWSKAGSPGTDALLGVAGFHWALLLTRNGQFPQALYLLSSNAKNLALSSALIEALGLAALRLPFLPETYPQGRREAVWLAGMASYYSIAMLSDSRRSSVYAERLLRLYGRDPNVHYFRGTQLSVLGQWNAAINEFRKELEISPEHAPALTEWAICEVAAGQPSSAIVPAKRALLLDPQSARAHYALGRALFETGSYQASVKELEIAKRFAPASSRIRFALFFAYKRLGREQDSKREQAAFERLKGKEEVLFLPDTLTGLPSPAANGRPK